MATKINFKNFQKDDDVVITVLDDGNEETLSGKIKNISLSKKVIHLEDSESEYECKFSEIKSIDYVRKGLVKGNNKKTRKIVLFALVGIFIAAIFAIIYIKNYLDNKHYYEMTLDWCNTFEFEGDRVMCTCLVSELVKEVGVNEFRKFAGSHSEEQGFRFMMEKLGAQKTSEIEDYCMRLKLNRLL